MIAVKTIPCSKTAPDYSVVIEGVTYMSILVKTCLGDIETVIVGEGSPLIVVHGIVGAWWQGVSLAAKLKDNFRVILISRPGYGRTPITSGNSANEQAKLFSELLEELQIYKSHILGFSGGGPSALAFALNHKEQCKSLILAVAAAPHLYKPSFPIWLITKSSFIVNKFIKWERKKMQKRLKNFESAYLHYKKDMNPNEIELLKNNPEIARNINVLIKNNCDGVSTEIGMKNDFEQSIKSKQDGRILAENVKVPTFIFHGTPDVIVPTEHAVYYASVIPDSDLKIYEGASHLLMWTYIDVISKDITDFLKKTKS